MMARVHPTSCRCTQPSTDVVFMYQSMLSLCTYHGLCVNTTGGADGLPTMPGHRDSVRSSGSALDTLGTSSISIAGSSTAPSASLRLTGSNSKPIVTAAVPDSVDPSLLSYLACMGHAAAVWSLLQRDVEQLRYVGLTIISRSVTDRRCIVLPHTYKCTHTRPSMWDTYNHMNVHRYMLAGIDLNTCISCYAAYGE
jgi:hypothetical protein